SCSVHDTADLERRGIPSAFVASDAFRDGADGQADALGVDPAVVYVPHPIQDRTDDEVRAIADDVYAAVRSALVAEVR
ncbi:MAG: UGSC family (seleno)protein, partial [Myxococcota bacterium]